MRVISGGHSRNSVKNTNNWVCHGNGVSKFGVSYVFTVNVAMVTKEEKEQVLINAKTIHPSCNRVALKSSSRSLFIHFVVFFFFSDDHNRFIFFEFRVLSRRKKKE